MKTALFSQLVILEMANNHMGDVEHGLRIIRELARVVQGFSFQFALKFQYRDLDTLIHPDYRDRTDIKYIKRFSQTRLSEADFLRLKAAAEQGGFMTICTPFDENSVDRVVAHNYRCIKIASCSFTDWPLLEKIALTDKPVIASTAGAHLDDIDRVVSFLQHRGKEFALMHCVGSYPTPDSALEMNQIDLFRQRYPGVPIGFSTHEAPEALDPVKIALAKGAEILERHVGVATAQAPLNAYSSSPEQLRAWLEAATAARALCGVSGRRREISQSEQDDLRGLQRGVFAAADLASGNKITRDNVLLAIPNAPGQLLANDLSKYLEYTLGTAVPAGAAIFAGNLQSADNRPKVMQAIRKLCALLKESGIKLQDKLDLELSHHYGLDAFDRYGCAIITCVNREYCKKVILLLPGQENPRHWHAKKEETFHVLHGDLQIELNGIQQNYSPGSIIVVERGCQHAFSSIGGAILEEISTTHYQADSFYADAHIGGSSSRKTYMQFRTAWLEGDIR